jgi:hypothetical protein
LADNLHWLSRPEVGERFLGEGMPLHDVATIFRREVKLGCVSREATLLELGVIFDRFNGCELPASLNAGDFCTVFKSIGNKRKSREYAQTT